LGNEPYLAGEIIEPPEHGVGNGTAMERLNNPTSVSTLGIGRNVASEIVEPPAADMGTDSTKEGLNDPTSAFITVTDGEFG
jgi:hypothetical protein